MMRAVVLAVLLLAPIALAQQDASPIWSQSGGDMGRSSVAALSGRTLDVVATLRFLDEGERTAPIGPAGLVETREGAAVVGVDGTRCRILVLSPETRATRQVGEAYTCDPGPAFARFEEQVGASTFHGGAALSLPERDAVLVATPGTPGVDALRLVSLADGSTLWSASAPRAPDDLSTHTVLSVSFDPAERVLVVPSFSTDGSAHARLSTFDVDTGELGWSIPVSTLWRSILPGSAPTSEFIPAHAALTPRGIVVSGIFVGGNQQVGSPPGLAWLDREGTVVNAEAVGADSLQLPSSRGVRPAAASEWPTTSGDRGAWATLGTLVVVDVENPTPRRYPIVDLVSGRYDRTIFELAPPAWWQDIVLVPGNERLHALSPADGAPSWETPWSAPPNAFIMQVVIVPPGTAYVVAAVTLDDRNELTLHRLDLRSGKEVMRLALPLDVPAAPNVFDGTILPLVARDELLVWTDNGQAVVLSTAPEPPAVEVSDEYPPVSGPVRVTTPSTPDVTNVSIAWGDGSIEAAAPGETRTHQYEEARPRVLRVTAYHTDGTTATAERVIRVGEPRPRELTAIQQAFEPENQNYTLFFLGLAVTGGGALFAALLQRRRHSRLAEEERELKLIIDDSLLKPTTGLAALEAHRAHLRDAHTRRRLDNAQFGLLDARTVRAMKSARYRLLGSSLNKLSPHFRRVLDTALEDGQVTSGEMAALQAMLADEATLSADERERVAALLTAWAR